MGIQAGDQLVIEGHRVRMPPRRGEVLAVEGSTLTVRWDDGHESIFVPGPDCRIISERQTEDIERLDVNI